MSTLESYVEYMYSSAEEELETAKYLFRGRKYLPCLFFCHLALEKLLKGIIALELGKPAPFVHNLKTLAEKTKINFTNEQLDQFAEISEFNIAGRYKEFREVSYQKTTKQYTTEYISIIEDLYQCIKKEYQKK